MVVGGGVVGFFLFLMHHEGMLPLRHPFDDFYKDRLKNLAFADLVAKGFLFTSENVSSPIFWAMVVKSSHIIYSCRPNRYCIK